MQNLWHIALTESVLGRFRGESFFLFFHLHDFMNGETGKTQQRADDGCRAKMRSLGRCKVCLGFA